MDDLSDAGRLALAFVDGGSEWLSSAASRASPPYDFPDETSMVAHGQQALHDSPLSFLPQIGLRVSPIKLMTFDVADLRALAQAETGAHDPSTAGTIETILRAHGLLTQADLADARIFLGSLGVGDAPLFRSIGFNATVALHGLATSPVPGDAVGTQREAASFALRHARAPAEFCDYYRAYLALKTKLADRSPDRAAARADSAVQTLRPLIAGALASPRVGGMVQPPDVAAAVRDWLRQGRPLGFSRLSEGICRIIDSTPFCTETVEAAKQIVERYLAEAQTFLSANEPKTGRISQDGRSCLMPVRAENAFAELDVRADGGITLRRFAPLPAGGE